MKIQWQQVRNALKVLVSLALITWLLYDIDYEQFTKIVRKGNPKFFMAALAILAVGFFMQAYRLHVLIRSLTHGLGHSLKIFFLGFFFNNLLPSSIGGDAVRMFYLKRSGNSAWGTPFSMLLFHRLIGFLVLLTGGVIYSFFRFAKVKSLIADQLNVEFAASYLKVFIALGILASVLILSYFFRQKLRDFLRNCQWALNNLQAYEYALVTILAAGFHFCRMAGFSLLLLFFNQPIPLVEWIFILFATAIIALIPISLGGLGVVEGTIATLLGIYGVIDSAAIGVALINRGFLILVSLTGGLFYMLGNINPEPATPEEAPEAETPQS
jgi:uncharacterized protein (TIRG00374 family)